MLSSKSTEIIPVSPTTLKYRPPNPRIVNHWPWQIVFNEYVIGEPNIITLPIRMQYKKSFWKNKNRNAEKWSIKKIKVICYNEVFPRVLEVDSDILAAKGVVRVGDLLNTLPPGIALDSLYENSLNAMVVSFKPLEEDLRDQSYMMNQEKLN